MLARAGYEKRLAETGERGFDTLVEVVMDGVARIRKGRSFMNVDQVEFVSHRMPASPAGDPRLRVEKFFSGVVSRDDGISLWFSAECGIAVQHLRGSLSARARPLGRRDEALQEQLPRLDGLH